MRAASRASSLTTAQPGSFRTISSWPSSSPKLQAPTPSLVSGGNETLSGGLGDDHLFGGDGSDIYVFNRGDGRDVIEDNGSNDNDIVRIGGYLPTDLILRESKYPADSLVIRFAGTDDELTIVNTLDLSAEDQIEALHFDNGAVWTIADVKAKILLDRATPENDTINGFNGNDLISGGKGSDVLNGGSGADTYSYARGDSYDLIIDAPEQAGDVLQLRGIDPSSVLVRRGVGDDLDLLIAESAAEAGDAGRVTIRNSFLSGSLAGVEAIQFDDGTVWTRPMIESLAVRNVATPGDDRLTGTSAADDLAGGAGDDYTSGGLGNDVYRFTLGDGSDTIRDFGDGQDRIEISGYARSEVSFSRRGRDGQDLIIRLGLAGEFITVINGLSNSAIDRIENILLVSTGETISIETIRNSLEFGSASEGDDQIIGGDDSDTLRGGAGADLLVGAGGDDTYVYRSGDGDDRIADDAASANDRLVLENLRSTDLASVRRSSLEGFDLVLRFTGGQDRVTLADSLATGNAGVESVVFADGVTWTRTEMRAAVLTHAATQQAESIRAFDGADILTGLGGNDLLTGQGGADTYRFARGDGQDTVDDNSNSAGDKLLLTDILSLEATVSRLFKASNDIVLTFASGNDSVTIRDMLAADGTGLEQIEFADGIIWTREIILDLLENNAPVATDDGIYSFKLDAELHLSPAELLQNDFDPDDDAISILSVAGDAHVAAQINAQGHIVVTALDGYTGPAEVSYTISDGRNGLATGIVSVRVAPLAFAKDDYGFTVAEDGFLSISAERLLSNDIDGDRMIVAQVFDATHGHVSLSSNGQISFTPSLNYNGLATFKYVANTPEGGRAEAVVNLTVTAVNDAPDARNDLGFSTDEDVPFEINTASLLLNDTDIDGDRLKVTSVTSSTDLIVELTDDGYIIVRPSAFFFGSASFSYAAADASGALDTATVTVNVRPVNNNPEPKADSFSTQEDAPILITAASLTANDIERDGDGLVISSVRRGYGGTVELFDNQTVLFTPQPDFYGQAHFFYTVDDGQGGLVEARVNVQTDSVNDAPHAANNSYEDDDGAYLRGTEDTPLIIQALDLFANDGDIDGFALELRTISYSENGLAEILADGSIRFTPTENYWGEASFRYVIADEGGLVDDALVTMYFEPVGDAPPHAVNDTITIYEDVETIIPVAALLENDTDIDNDVLELLSVQISNRGGSVRIDADGNIVFKPSLNSNFPAEFFYTVSDNADGTDVGTVSVIIIPVNDSPTAAADSGGTSLDVPLVLRISDLMANDSDIDLYPGEYGLLDFVGIRSASDGTASIYGNEFVVVEYARGFFGNTSLEYTIEDEHHVEDDGTILAVVSSLRSETLSGSAIRDLLIGSYLAERIEGGAGDDDIFAREGDDIIVGGDDADRIDGGDGYDTVEFTGSNIGVRADLQAIIGQGGHAQGDLYFNIEALTGTGFADELGGNAGDNRLSGLGGADRLRGRGGADILEGGIGNDLLEGGSGADTLSGGEGADTADYSASATSVSVSLAEGTASGGDAAGDTLTSVENLTGTDFDDQLEGDQKANILIGGRGSDVLVGHDGDDVLVGGRGADSLQGGAGIDRVEYLLSLEGVTVNLADTAAGGGDAQGDTFSSIELIVGSYHNDTMIGDAADNVFRGGLGADLIDGGGGFDVADYASATEAVAVDLASGPGSGSAGEAAGDILVNIEKLIGTAYNDSFAGSSGDDTFDGRFGDDLLTGRAGSDRYLFGYDSGSDTIIENGSSADLDQIILASGIRPADISVIRDGDNLLIELEHDDGLLIDTALITGHFLGRETGIEEIVFADGTVWDRSEIDALSRTERFNAAADVIRFADEDIDLVILADRLTRNDAAAGTDALQIISVSNYSNSIVSLTADGNVNFRGAKDFWGDAFFDYTVRDPFGRESTGRAEVNVLPVNDAPVAANDGVFTGLEDNSLYIPVSALLGNDFDVDGDTLTISPLGFGPALGLDGQPLYQMTGDNASFGNAHVQGGFVVFTPSANHNGYAGFRYAITDGHGEFSTAQVELTFVGVNDAPTAVKDEITVRQGVERMIFVDNLLGNDFDVEEDDFYFDGIGAVVNGSALVQEVYIVDGGWTRVIMFTGDELGSASITYKLVDEHGATSTGAVDIDVIPVNDPPNARNDSGFTTLEDQPIIIDPAALLANDSDPNGDVLSIISFERFPLNGKVAYNEDGMIVFTPRADYNGRAGFSYTISDGRGGEDEAFVTVSIVPDNDGPIVRNDVVAGVEDVPVIVLAAEAFANDIEPDGDVIFFEDAHVLGVLSNDVTHRQQQSESFDLRSPLLSATASVAATLADGSSLPAWLTFNAGSLTFTGTPPLGESSLVNVSLVFTDVDAAGAAVTFTDALEIDPTNIAALQYGIAYDADLMAVSLTTGAWSARLTSGQDLPSWLAFDPLTRTLARTDVEPPLNNGLSRVQVIFTPQDNDEAGFAVEFLIDPAAPLDPAVNTLLAGDPYFAAHGLFVLPVADDATVSAEKESGFDLAGLAWL